VATSTTEIIDSMLVANQQDGSPNFAVRHKGAEMRHKCAEQYDSLTEGDDGLRTQPPVRALQRIALG